MPQQIQTTTENATVITAEVGELLAKRAIVEARLDPDSFVSQIFLVEKSEASDKPGGPQSVCKTRWRAFTSSQISSSQGIGWPRWIEGCIPPGPNAFKPSTTSHLPLGREMLPIYLPTICPVICPKGIYEATCNETSGRISKAGLVRPNNISGWSVDHASRRSPATADNLTEQSAIRMSGIVSQSEKICTRTYTEAVISQLHDTHPVNGIINSPDLQLSRTVFM